MKLSKITSLNREQLLWIIRAYFRLWIINFRLRSKDSEWLTSKLNFTKSKNNSAATELLLEASIEQRGHDSEVLRAKQMHESVRIAARLHVTKTDCLPRSLVLVEMLNSTGNEAELKIGVTKDSKGALASHAWVEMFGVMVAEPESVGLQFKELVRSGSD